MRKGFTVIEIIIVLAIIAVIGTLAAVAVNAARAKQRDATRISLVRQIQTGLEDHFNEVNAYPASEGIPLGDAAQSACLGTGGFQADCSADQEVFLRVIPGTIAKGLDGLVRCGEPARDAICYLSLQENSTYVIEFELENDLRQVGLVQGVNCALPGGMQGGRCPR